MYQRWRQGQTLAGVVALVDGDSSLGRAEQIRWENTAKTSLRCARCIAALSLQARETWDNPYRCLAIDKSSWGWNKMPILTARKPGCDSRALERLDHISCWCQTVWMVLPYPQLAKAALHAAMHENSKVPNSPREFALRVCDKGHVSL